MRGSRHLGALSVMALVLVFASVAGGSRDSETCCGSEFVTSGDTLYQVSRGQRYEIVAGSLSVRFASGARSSAIDSLNATVMASESVTFEPGLTVLEYPDTLDPLDVLEAYCSSPLVDVAELTAKAKWAASPNDTYYSSRQWDMAPTHMDACGAWGICSGDTTAVIGIIDDGILSDHEDLEDALWVNWPETTQGGGSANVDDDGNGWIDDLYGWNFHSNTNDVYSAVGDHGTSVAGVAGAVTNNGTGVAGVAGGWGDGTAAGSDGGCRLMPVMVLPGDANAAFASAIRYAAGSGADVINMSWTLTESDIVGNAIAYATETLGVTCVAASGNGGAGTDPSVQFPASRSDVIAVGATWRGDEFADRYSSYGPNQSVVAPSSPCIRGPSSASGDECANQPLNYTYTTEYLGSYEEFSGTSCATPHVSGLAALLVSSDSSLDSDDVRGLIEASAEDLVGDDTTRGHDDYYGYGRINAYAALFLARGGGATTSNLRLCYDVEFDRDVKVSSGDTLTILPDVEISFASGSDAANLGIDSNRCELIIEGALIAEGIDADTLVTFTTEVDSAGAWYGIRAPADTGMITMEYCAVENAYKGVSAENPDGLSVSDVDIDNCISHGIWVKECGSSTTVTSCTITDPGLIGIEATDCDGLVLSDHDISGATTYGIKCQDAEGMTVEDNTVLGASGESGFVGLHYVCASGDTTLTIEDNTVSRCGSRGIYCEGGGDGTSSITGNVISDDGYDRGTVGIYLKTSRAEVHYNETEKKGTGVSVLPGMGTPKWIPDLGNGTSQQQGNNSWLDNTTWYVWTLLSSPDTLYAESNWHGTKNPSSSMFSSTVDYLPVLESAPSARISPGADDTESYAYSLSQNRPNPFNPTTTIEYSIWVPGRVTLRVYNMAGKLVRTLVNAVHEPGYHDVIWDGSDDQGRQVAGGVYFARLVSGGETKMRKLILLK